MEEKINVLKIKHSDLDRKIKSVHEQLEEINSMLKGFEKEFSNRTDVKEAIEKQKEMQEENDKLVRAKIGIVIAIEKLEG